MFEPDVGQINMRADASDLLEEAREVILGKVRRRSYLFERKLALIVVMHELDGAAQPPVYGSGSRQLNLGRFSYRQMRAQ